MAHYKWMADMIVPLGLYYDPIKQTLIPKARIINMARAIDMIVKFEKRKKGKNHRGR